MRSSRMAAPAVVAVLLGSAVAAGQGNMTPPNYQGRSAGTSWSMSVKFGTGGKPVRVRSFVWDGFKCQSDRFTGGTSKSIAVSNGRFASTQLVGGIDKRLSMTVKGSFSADGKKASGTVKVQGCAGTRTWSMKKTGH